MESYRSGHNEPDSKSGSPKGLEGSNPSLSAPKLHDSLSCSFCFKIDSKIGDIDENDRSKKAAQSNGKRRIG